MARMYLKQGKYDEAIRLLNDMVRKGSPSATRFANLANGGKKMWKEELANYRKAAARETRDQAILYNLAVSLENNKRDPGSHGCL